jgi:L-2,4-diaminobutyric acid acetyltransferase
MTTVNLVEYRKATFDDAKKIHEIVKKTPGIDDNSLYYYSLWLKEFDQSNVVAVHNKRIVAFLTAFRKPKDNSTLFLWQLAAVPRHGIPDLGVNLSYYLIDDEIKKNLSSIEATIDLNNKSILYVMKKLEKRYNGNMHMEEYLSEEYLSGNENHHTETLLKITL